MQNFGISPESYLKRGKVKHFLTRLVVFVTLLAAAPAVMAQECRTYDCNAVRRQFGLPPQHGEHGSQGYGRYNGRSFGREVGSAVVRVGEHFGHAWVDQRFGRYDAYGYYDSYGYPMRVYDPTLYQPVTVPNYVVSGPDPRQAYEAGRRDAALEREKNDLEQKKEDLERREAELRDIEQGTCGPYGPNPKYHEIRIRNRMDRGVLFRWGKREINFRDLDADSCIPIQKGEPSATYFAVIANVGPVECRAHLQPDTQDRSTMEILETRSQETDCKAVRR